MSAAPAGAQILGELPNNRVDERVEGKGNRDREADELPGKMDHLIVEEQQDGLKAVVLHPERHGAEAIEDFRSKAGQLVLRRRVGHKSSPAMRRWPGFRICGMAGEGNPRREGWARHAPLTAGFPENSAG